MPDVGDTATLTLTIDPADGTTAATVAVVSPSGTASAPEATVSVSDGVGTATALLPLTEAGAWSVTWTVTGMGYGTQADTVYAFTVGAEPAEGTSYATLSDLANHLGEEPPTNAGTLLKRATRRIDSVLIGSVYDVDDDGDPTDADVIAALRDAVCEQVGWWIENGNTSGTSGGQEYTSVSVGNVSLSTGGRGGQTSGSAQGARSVSPEAIEILRLAELLPLYPYVRG